MTQDFIYSMISEDEKPEMLRHLRTMGDNPGVVVINIYDDKLLVGINGTNHDKIAICDVPEIPQCSVSKMIRFLMEIGPKKWIDDNMNVYMSESSRVYGDDIYRSGIFERVMKSIEDNGYMLINNTKDNNIVQISDISMMPADVDDIIRMIPQ